MSVFYHRQLDGAFDSWPRLTTKQTSQLHIASLLWGESANKRRNPPQRDGNAGQDIFWRFVIEGQAFNGDSLTSKATFL